MSNELPWLASYADGVPEQINVDDYASVSAVLDEAFAKFRDRPAFTSFGKTLDYGQIDTLSKQFAGYLTGVLKLTKGDRVALMMPNVLQYPIALFGALRAGMVVVNTNPLYTSRELQHQLADAGVRAIVVLENFAAVLQDAASHVPVEHIVTTGVGDMLGAKGALMNFALRHLKKKVPAYQLPGAVKFRDALMQGSTHKLPAVQLGHDDVAFLQYTGGTTGVAKGAMLTHGNMVANMLQASAWFNHFIRDGEEVIVTALPLYHIFALTCNCLLFARAGGESLLITNPRDMPGFVKTLGKSRFTAITGVNTLFNGLLNTPGFDKIDFSHLRMSFGGGMAVQRRVAEQWQEVTGCALIEGYGMTESSPVATINTMVEGASFTGSIGLPISSTEISIQDDDGRELDIEEVGEICIRGPQVMKGYWNQPEETRKVLSDEGWLRSGDIGRMDDKGLVYIVDRKKDMILVSGFNVYPNEIEDVAMHCPGVTEVAAVGVADEHSGEVVKLFVVRKDPSLTAEQVKAYCHEHLTGYKRPRFIEFRDELPKSNVGKILRRELRDDSRSRTQTSTR